MTHFIRKLFNKKPNAATAKSPTAPATVDDQAAATIPSPTRAGETAPLSQEQLVEGFGHLNPTQLIVGCGHSIGKQRDHNEDALFALSTTLVSDNKQIMFGLFIIADGMGGHQHGEIASSLATRAIVGNIVRKIYLPLFSLRAEPPTESLQEVMKEAIMEGHQTIVRESANSGTTVTVAVILGDQLMISHVGDSRAYAIYPDGSYKILTRDHSLVKRLEELGQITSEEAAIHPQRNVLYRALGQNEPFEPDNHSHPLPRGGYLLLCSDGMWGSVPADEITHIVLETPNPEIACQKLVNASNAAGGPDNISVILVRIPE